MKDFFNQRQRYSLRKYSIGVCSVLLGIVLFSGQAVQADEVITGNDNVVKSVEAAESAISDTTISEVPTAIEKLPVEEVVTVQNETVSKQQDTSSETNTSRNSTSFASSEESYVAQVNQSQATSDLSEGLKSETITSEISRTSLRRGRILASEETVESPTEILSSEAIPAEIPIRRSGRRGRNLSSLNTSESNNGTPINSSLPTVTIPTSNQNNTLATPDENITKSTKQTVVFEGAGEKTPATNIKDDYVFTGKKDLTTNAITWKTSSHTYGSVPVPVVPGYYADKAEAGFKTVTLDEPEVTDKVIYKPLGKIIQVDENFNVIPNSNSVTYENNPYNPREAVETAIPAAPAGYKIRELQPHAWGYNIVDKTIEPNDESDPDRISKDTPIVYVALTSDVTKSTKQTVVFEGAGEKTPATNIKDDYVFTGKKDLITNAITWKTSSHTYGSVPVPVVPGYIANKSQAGQLEVTVATPNAEETVSYTPVGRIILVDETGNQIVGTNAVPYTNASDPTKVESTTLPTLPAGYEIKSGQNIPGFNSSNLQVLPPDATADTKIILVSKKESLNQGTSQTVTFVGAGENTPTTKVQNDFVFTGTKDMVSGVSTWDVSSHRYGSVPVPVVPGYIADKSQAGQLEVTVATPNAEELVSYTPVGRIILVDEAGNQIVGTDAVPYNNSLDPTKVESTTLPTLPTGYEIKPGQNISGLNSSNLQVLPPDATAETKIILVSKKESLSQGTSQTVTFVGAGENTPTTKVQNDFVFTGTKDMVSGVSTWDVSSHRYGSVPVPVVPGYIADKSQAGQLEVTVATPNAEETVSYTPVGRIILVDEAGNQIVGTDAVPYNNSLDPTKVMSTTLPTLPAGYEIKSGQNILGLNSSSLQVLPPDATADTKIILVSKKETLSQVTSQTVTFVGAGENTPTTKVQNDFVFTGPKDMVSGVSTWDVSSHTYGSVPVPVVPGYIADVGHAGSLQVTPEAPNAEELVTYKPLGKIIAVDTDGKEIQGVPTIQYQNDPENPTKAGKTLSPLISGYETDVLSITPSKPEEDTPVVYRKAIQEATITYIDQTTGISLESDRVTGKSGEIIEYTTADKIAFYESRGYELLTDELPKQAHYDTDTSVVQAWRVTLKHRTVIVGSRNPHDGDVINPDDPLSPNIQVNISGRKMLLRPFIMLCQMEMLRHQATRFKLHNGHAPLHMIW